MDNIHVVNKTTLTVGKKPFVLVLLYLGSIFLQTRNKLKKSLQKSLIIVNIRYCQKIRLGKIKHLPLLSTINLCLVEFTHISTAFYHLPKN